MRSDMAEWLWVPWGKSNAAGATHSVLGHLMDSAAVAVLMWERFLAQRSRDELDRVSQGRGRDLLVLMAGWHDLGKFTPAFQAKQSQLAGRTAEVGWTLPVGQPVKGIWHGPSGERIAQRVLKASRVTGSAWLLPIIAGHHGSFRSSEKRPYDGEWQVGPVAHKDGWREGQDALAHAVADAWAVDLSDWRLETPSLTWQLAVAGWVSMADWIASSDLFPGLGERPCSRPLARERAEAAWTRLGLPAQRPTALARPFAAAFGFVPRPLQRAVVECVEQVRQPGLVIVEAPMGEGKTEAAFAAVEVLTQRFGLEGCLFAMPTQGTTDAMYDRFTSWASEWSPAGPATLLHGKRMANEHWRELLSGVALSDVCDIEDDDCYGILTAASTVKDSGAATPAEWLLGRHRGLLSSLVVGTVDQPLMAATHIKYVALRFAGLVGKVVVIDEVHSYDVFMSRYLHQFLRWCSDAGVPVVLMSATLPPQQRAELLSAYSSGLDGLDHEALAGPVELAATWAEPIGYPSVTTWSPADGARTMIAEAATTDREVQIQWADIDDPEDLDALAQLVIAQASAGGCVLVILNTVRRAQEVYRAVRDKGLETTLLHGRLTTARRAELTQELVQSLGRAGPRPSSRIVIATQIAEQSFDVDADLLITDIAPTDLLLQRIGRLHRHQGNEARRPEHLRLPRAIVTGATVPRGDEPPRFAAAFEYVYDRHALLRTAQLIGDGAGVHLPSQIPHLVAAAYDESAPWPAGWQDAAAQAHAEATESRSGAATAASRGVLCPNEHGGGTLNGLHDRSGVEKVSERITVRDGEPSREVALVRWDPLRECFTTLSGRRLGSTGEAVSDLSVEREVLGDTVRVRQSERLDERDWGPRPLAGWAGSDLLRSLPALVLDDGGHAEGSWGQADYDEEFGLVIARRSKR